MSTHTNKPITGITLISEIPNQLKENIKTVAMFNAALEMFELFKTILDYSKDIPGVPEPYIEDIEALVKKIEGENK